jgi:Subtilase family/Peptidase inhibitor I9
VRQKSRRVLLAAAGAGAIVAAGFSTPALARTQQLPATHPSALTPAQIVELSANANQKVIVLLRNQHQNVAAASGRRASAIASDQSSVTGELRQLHAPKLHAYSFVNAVSATVSKAEAARLAQNSNVLAVVPDRVVTLPSSSTATSSSGTATTHAAVVHPNVATAQTICPSDPSVPLLEPEALQSMNVEFQPGSTQPAAHQLADGSGVKIAVFPDGLDPNLPDFMRGGTSAIFDYKDFSGDGPNAVTSGAEAFGDASSIISQGTQVYDLSGEVNPAHALPAGCNIRVKGVAPGADLAVMKVFGNQNSALNSEILQGMEYAVNVDHVDILSESFGGNPVPNPGTDPIAVFDQDAVNAGITVVASSGDAGVTNTIGSPAVDPGVISAAASTDYQLYAQTTSYGYQLGSGGWQSDQISGLSSSGVTEANRTVDVTAPGEANWSDCSPNTATFAGCSDQYHGAAPQPIEAFGGTSESAPLTAGTAALVIESYRSTHSGTTPSPALVKQIIMSTSRDINSRAADQGPGLIDSLRAVQAARSVGTTPQAGSSDVLLYSPNAINQIGAPGSSSTTDVSVTNVGASTETIAPSVRALGSATTIAGGTLTLNEATDPTFIYQTGATYGDVHEVPFTVPAGSGRLHAAIAWNPDGQPSSTVRFDLFDPSGRLVMQSRPQGAGEGFSEVEVHDAAAGTWTLATFAAKTGTSYTGSLVYSITSQAFAPGGTVSPSTFTLASGASTTFAVTTTTLASPGDSSESLTFGTPTSGDERGTVAITQRSLVPVTLATGGAFTGTVTDGNGRMAFYGQEVPYQFDVPAGARDIEANLHVDSPGYQLFAFLVDPDGTPVDVQSSADPGGFGPNHQNVSLARRSPAAGRWSLFVTVINGTDSLQTSSGFEGTISFNRVSVTATGVPHSSVTPVHAHKASTATIHVVNTGTNPEWYSIDPRLSGLTTMSLSSLSPTTDPLPITNFANVPQFVVPPFSQSLSIGAISTVPITLDVSPNFGTPDVEAVSSGDSAVATVNLPEVPASAWSCAPAEVGPFASAAPATTFSCGASAQTNPFDPGVTSSTGNIWSALEGFTNAYSPLVLQPGQSGDITVSFESTAKPGTVVSGFLGVESFNFNTISSDELVNIPYQYRAAG